MIMNYNEWFHNYHRYLQGHRDGVTGYIDTKWNTLNDRYRSLIDISSTLLDEQPYGVVGNYVGFQQLNQLIQNSGYTYDDVDTSFIDMYRMNLQNAMGNMMVNTHAVIANYTQRDTSHVSKDPYGHYYIIDVPFAQLHFGERDEFIRQKLHQFYETENQYYMPSDKFLSDEISKILGFTLLCCTNGMMTDDWAVGIDEKGFRIKIGWKYASDVNFIVYKLDDSTTLTLDVAYENVVSEMEMPYEMLGISDPCFHGKNCIIQIMNAKYTKDVSVVPNFGYFTETGLQISNLQSKTIADFNHQNTKGTDRIKLRVYIIKYLNEVEGIFPAINYLEMVGTHLVYNDRYQHITDDDGKYIHSRETVMDDYTSDICTPPISPMYDYSSTKNHSIIRDCYNIIPVLQQSISKMSNIMAYMQNPYRGDHGPVEVTEREYYMKNMIQPATELYAQLEPAYESYLQGAIITSLIQKDDAETFGLIVEQLNLLVHADPSVNGVNACMQTSVLYDVEYQPAIMKIIASLQHPPFTTLGQIPYPDYFNRTNSVHQLLRPMSEQCFLALKYNADDDMQCWVFDVPNLKHFNGIENVFYIDDNLTGDEIFKFLYLYTTTDDPAQHDDVSPLTFNQLMDFDLFSNQMRKYIGYVKFWNVSNRLAKLSKMMYEEYTDDTIISILSRILKHKMDGDIFLDYPSEINYEISNITTENTKDFTEYSERAPFSLNFMFYTLKMLFDHPDQLQSYFMDVLTRKEFYPRYADLKLSDLYEHTDHIAWYTDTLNYSVISYTPRSVAPEDARYSVDLPDDNELHLFSGINCPIEIQTSGDQHWFASKGPMLNNGVRYPWSYNLVETGDPHPMLTDHSIDHLKYASIHATEYGIPSQYIAYKRNTFYDDAQIAKMICVYVSEIAPGMSQLFTDYKNIWNQTTVVHSLMKTMQRNCDKINTYISSRGEDITYRNANTEDVLVYFPEVVDDRDQFYAYLEILETRYLGLKAETGSGSMMTNIFTVTSNIVSMLNKIYEYTGFDRYAIRRIRKSYMHLKQINSPMSLYAYKKWIDEIDMELLENLPEYFSNNPNMIYTPEQVQAVVERLQMKLANITMQLHDLEDVMAEFQSYYEEGYLPELRTYCDDVIQNNIFNFYKMNAINIPETIINIKPAFAEIHIDADDPHVDFGLIDDFITNQNTFELLLGVKFDTDATNIQYYIHQIIPTCTYAFASGEPMTVSIHLYDHELNEITTIDDVTITFAKVGTSADIKDAVYPYSNSYDIPFEVQNVHETFDINGTDNVVNIRHAEMHYEMLCGNRFVPLDHTSEYCSPSKDLLQGPIDKLYLSCERINDLSFTDQTSRPLKSMFFQPTQVFHIEPVDDVITSIGGKYFEGQRIYAVTDDGLCLIPMIITAIDHSLERGMIEAKVDLRNAKWFETTDPDVMTKYLTTDIACTIVDDNIRNFLDEFTDYDGSLYPIPDITSTMNENHEVVPQFLSLPGDPYFVETNPDYVYARLVDMFPDGNHQNPDDPYHRFVYIGSYDVHYSLFDDDPSGDFTEQQFYINLINHDFNPYTLPELYPVLRDEPDDLQILKEEKAIFDTDAEALLKKATDMRAAKEYVDLQNAVINAQTDEERKIAQDALAAYEKIFNDLTEEAQRAVVRRRDLETPTTWYNVRAYEDAMTYINNGRAKTFRTLQVDIRDIPFTDQLEIRLYDWKHQQWIDPDNYLITVHTVDGVQIDPVNIYKTDNVLPYIRINITGIPVLDAPKLLVYLVYSSKDQFDIPMNDMNCTVRFRPVLSLKSTLQDDSVRLYDDVRIRKHYDANETMTMNYMTYGKPELEPLPDEFESMDGFIFHRPTRSGTYTDGSAIRFGDMTVSIDNVTYTLDDFDVYIPNPLPNTTMDQVTVINEYDNAIIQQPDGFEPDCEITLMPISNQNGIQSNGVASNVLFTGITNASTITITSCTTSFSENTQVLCTVLPNAKHPISGGMIRVMITKSELTEPAIKNWIHLTGEIQYRLIPETVALVPKEVSISDNVSVSLTNHYIKNFDTDVAIDNSNPNDPYIYYYDTNYRVRYPIANIRKNQLDERFVIDRTLNENVQMIRSNYIGITRYISQHIPEDGIIDLTGKIPTPLSRDRYEIWVNGRFVNDPKYLLILSPTSFQLRNMISLKNLEVIELVDDIKDTVLTPSGPVYIDISGKTYGSYLDMIQHRANLMDESVEYCFNQMTHAPMDTYIPEPIRNPNNKDYELDILSYLTFDDTISSYYELYNIPTINGWDIYNMTSTSLGFMELPNEKILKQCDLVWKREALEGVVPFNHAAQYYDTNIKEQYLHVRKHPEGGFDIYTTGLDDHTFTLYISDQEDGNIDSLTHTKQIMPLLHPGVKIHIDDTYEDMWLHSTNPTADPIQIK